MNKNLMIGLGVLSVAGIAYYMYNKPKATEKKSEARGKTSTCSPILCDQFCGCVGCGNCEANSCTCRVYL